MWTDISQFDIPDHQKTMAYGSGKVDKFTDIGEVCVVSSIFGKARVRVIHPRKKRSLIWPLTALAATGAAVAIWLEQDIPKPPEPMRIIIRSVASEGTVQTSSQTSPGLNAKATVVAKPVTAQPALPLVKSEPAITVPAAKPLIPVMPQTTPLAPGNVQARNPAVVQQPAKPPAAIQPAAPVVKNEKPVTKPVAEPLPANNTKTMAPASNDPAPEQTGTQP